LFEGENEESEFRGGGRKEGPGPQETKNVKKTGKGNYDQLEELWVELGPKIFRKELQRKKRCLKRKDGAHASIESSRGKKKKGGIKSVSKHVSPVSEQNVSGGRETQGGENRCGA